MATWNTQQTQNLFQAILSLKTLDEAKRFFRDLLTEEEIVEASKRWRAAQMLNARIPYTRIEQMTGLSSTTIARVQRWLHGNLGGYRLAIHRAHRASQKTRLKAA